MVEELEQIHRPSASEGERRAAEWLVERFGELGAEARIEAEPAHGTYWWPLGIGAALGALGGIAALRGRRAARRAARAARPPDGCRTIPPGKRAVLRRLLPQRTAVQRRLRARARPTPSGRSCVIAHHDAAHSRHRLPPGAAPASPTALGLIEGHGHQPAADGAGRRRPGARRRSARSPDRAPADAGSASVLGARLGGGDGRTSACARSCRAPTTTAPAVRRPAGAGRARCSRSPTERPARDPALGSASEESFSEGIKAFGERHFAALPRESTFFLCLDTLGSPHLLVLRGEGFLQDAASTPSGALALMDGLAEELGVHLFPNLRLRNGTDGLEPLAAGYETAVLASCTELKQPANYHWWHDLAENVDFNTVADGIRLDRSGDPPAG